MPICNIILSESVTVPTVEQIDAIRDIVSDKMEIPGRPMNRDHIVVRLLGGSSKSMLGMIEIEIYGERYKERLDRRDEIAYLISKNVSEIMGLDCATWINLVNVGYCRVTSGGDVFYSD